MPKPDLTKRFRELVANLSDTELGAILGITADGARKLRVGDTKTLKLHMALKLARELQVSPWYLAGEPEPKGSVTSQLSIKGDAKSRDQYDKEGGQGESFTTLRAELSALKARVDRLERAQGKHRA